MAPKRRAISWRGACRDIATTRSAPSSTAASTAHRPTAPSPTTATVSPGFTPAATAQCQPVGKTSERVSRDGTSAASGTSSVFTRLPSAWVTRAYSLWPLTVKPRCSQADWTPARQCTQVLSQWQNGTTTKSPGAKERTSAPTSATTPTISWPIVLPASTGFSPR